MVGTIIGALCPETGSGSPIVNGSRIVKHITLQ